MPSFRPIRNFGTCANSAASKLLEVVQKALSDAAKTAKAKTPRGGSMRYVVAPWVLLNLAEAYSSFGPGRRPSTDPNGPFGRFARGVVGAMGLPTYWIDGQIRAAVTEWRRRSEPR